MPSLQTMIYLLLTHVFIPQIYFNIFLNQWLKWKRVDIKWACVWLWIWQLLFGLCILSIFIKIQYVIFLLKLLLVLVLALKIFYHECSSDLIMSHAWGIVGDVLFGRGCKYIILLQLLPNGPILLFNHQTFAD